MPDARKQPIWLEIMKILIQNGRLIDPASGLDQICDVAVAAGRIVGLGRAPADFAPTRTIDASGCIVLPGRHGHVADLVKARSGVDHTAVLDQDFHDFKPNWPLTLTG